MSHLSRAALAATATCLLAAPGASAATATPTPTPQSSGIRVQIGASTGAIFLGRTETRQVGQGGAWVVAGTVAAALAPSTAGAGTFAAIAIGLALGGLSNQVVEGQLAKGQCLLIAVPWISLGTVANIKWYPCPA